jgi:hypothetical protein
MLLAALVACATVVIYSGLIVMLLAMLAKTKVSEEKLRQDIRDALATIQKAVNAINSLPVDQKLSTPGVFLATVRLFVSFVGATAEMLYILVIGKPIKRTEFSVLGAVTAAYVYLPLSVASAKSQRGDEAAILHGAAECQFRLCPIHRRVEPFVTEEDLELGQAALSGAVDSTGSCA